MRSLMAAFLVLAQLVLRADAALADVVPGDVVDRSNIEKAREVLHPGPAWCVEHGLVLQVAPWEKRKVWIVEGRSKFPHYAYGKCVLYVDQEAFSTPSTDIYDRNMELWKIWINGIRVGYKPFKGAKTSVYDYETGFIPNITMVDMQLAHATRAALPGHEFPDEEGWYWNMGPKVGLTPDFFAVAEPIRGGR